MTYKLMPDGLADKDIIATAETKTLTINGRPTTFQVYEINIDKLFYNDENGRISAFVRQYTLKNGVDTLSRDDIQNYNAIIEDLIVHTNAKALENTKKNIRSQGQLVPGVVLNDGRIVDGNRRFTCLRLINKEDPTVRFFKAVILDDFDNERNIKQIRSIELQLQKAVDKIVDYDPINDMYSIYNDVEVRQLYTVEELAKERGESKSNVAKKLAKAKLMNEFLKYINAPEQFEIASNLNIDGPLEDLHNLISSCRDEEMVEDVKRSAFLNILFKTKNDVGKQIIRPLSRAIKTNNPELYDNFMTSQKEIEEEVIDILDGLGTITNSIINNNIRTRTDLKERLKDSIETMELGVVSVSAKDKPLQLIENAISNIRNIDEGIVHRLGQKEKESMAEKIDELSEMINQIRGSLDAE